MEVDAIPLAINDMQMTLAVALERDAIPLAIHGGQARPCGSPGKGCYASLVVLSTYTGRHCSHHPTGVGTTARDGHFYLFSYRPDSPGRTNRACYRRPGILRWSHCRWAAERHLWQCSRNYHRHL